MTLEFPASTYPDSIFKQTTPDESQSLSDGPNYTELLKGWRTRSIIYERQLPDGTSNALRIQGPRGGNAAIILNDNGCVKIKCGPYNTNIAGSGYTTTPKMYVNKSLEVAEAIINDDGFVVGARVLDRSITFDKLPLIEIVGGGGYGARSVSYTHLTLPTKRIV